MATTMTSLMTRIFGEPRPRNNTRRTRRAFVIEGLEGRIAPSDLLGISSYSQVGGIGNGTVTYTKTSTEAPGGTTTTPTTPLTPIVGPTTPRGSVSGGSLLTA